MYVEMYSLPSLLSLSESNPRTQPNWNNAFEDANVLKPNQNVW